jgi:1-deoxy-D-xylulose-5-phosphate synthase
MYDEAGLNARHIAAKALEAMGQDEATAAERVAAVLAAG